MFTAGKKWLKIKIIFFEFPDFMYSFLFTCFLRNKSHFKNLWRMVGQMHPLGTNKILYFRLSIIHADIYIFFYHYKLNIPKGRCEVYLSKLLLCFLTSTGELLWSESESEKLTDDTSTDMHVHSPGSTNVRTILWFQLGGRWTSETAAITLSRYNEVLTKGWKFFYLFM